MWSPFVCFFRLRVCLCFVFLVDSFGFVPSLPAWQRCHVMPFAGYFLVRSLCLLSLLSSERIPGSIWFGSVYLVTTTGFAADPLM